MKYLLQEDECVPDAREYFDKELKDRFGFTVHDFLTNGFRFEPDESTIQYRLQSLVLEISSDDPFYRVFKDNTIGITIFVNKDENLPPEYSGYRGGFANITRCRSCGRVGLYEDQHTLNPCNACGGEVVDFGAGMWEDEAWYLRQR